MRSLRMAAAAAAFLTVCPLLRTIPASAETEAPAETVIEPVYEPDQPYAADLHLSVSGERPCQVAVYQDSPEAASLLVYHAGLPAESGRYVLSLEPGDYVVAVSASALSDSFAPLTEEQAFSVENPDYSEQLDRTDYQLDVDFSLVSEDAFPESSASELKQSLKNGVRTLSQQMHFSGYKSRLAGDFDGDGTVTAYDATLVLTDFALATAGFDDLSTTKEQIFSCDIDGSGALEAYDAVLILTYFSLSVAGFDPEWDWVLNP